MNRWKVVYPDIYPFLGACARSPDRPMECPWHDTALGGIYRLCLADAAPDQRPGSPSPMRTREEVEKLIAERGVVAAGNECSVAALIYTYRCTIACRHCGFSCAGSRPDVHMSAAQAVRDLRLLHELGRVLHVAGGECMLYWDDLRAALALAQQAGVSPHFLETNSSFAGSDEVVRARCEDLRALGLRGLLASADPFHQAFVPADHFLRVRRIAREVFGPENVWCTEAPDEAVREYARIACDEAVLAGHVRKSRLVMVGTAHDQLEPMLPEHDLDSLPIDGGWQVRHTSLACLPDFQRDMMWELHIDPYDNIVCNCGMILGDARRVTPREVLDRGPENTNEFTRLLALSGPVALARWAGEHHGYALPARARTKCGLCFEVRKFLRRFYPEVFGPAEIYGNDG